MAEFVSGRYEIYTQKEKTSDAGAPFSSGSPSRKGGAASNQRTSFGKLAKIGGAVIAVKQVATTVGSEISESTGDERLMKDVGNIGTGLAFGVMAFKAPPLAAAFALQQGAQTAANYREMQRENADRQMKEDLKGARTSSNRGGMR